MNEKIIIALHNIYYLTCHTMTLAFNGCKTLMLAFPANCEIYHDYHNINLYV